MQRGPRIEDHVAAASTFSETIDGELAHAPNAGAHRICRSQKATARSIQPSATVPSPSPKPWGRPSNTSISVSVPWARILRVPPASCGRRRSRRPSPRSCRWAAPPPSPPTGPYRPFAGPPSSPPRSRFGRKSGSRRTPAPSGRSRSRRSSRAGCGCTTRGSGSSGYRLPNSRNPRERAAPRSPRTTGRRPRSITPVL